LATLIINIRTLELKNIDLSQGLYFFGISAKNQLNISEETYQISNLFEGLDAGVYQWAVKHTSSGVIKARGSDIVKNTSGSGCYEHQVNNLNEITITLLEHKKDLVSNITCFRTVNTILSEFIPDTVEKLLDGSVKVTTNIPFTGKIYIC
jgi:hypothetical protein